MSASPRSVTMADVARLVDVHQATVSRVLNRPEAVNHETRTKVFAAIDELGYVPNAGARQLAGGRTGVIAALVPDLANPYFAALLKAIQRASKDGQSQLMVADTEFDAEAELGLLRTVGPNVDAIIVCSPVASTAKLRVAAAQRPLVFVNRSASRVSSVTVDQAEIVRIGVEHLRGLGHRRIGVVVGPDEYWSAAQRRRAVANENEIVVLDGSQPTFEAGRDVVDWVIDAQLTGVVAFNDLMALGVLAEANSRGLSVPGDISVVGSDDISPAAMATPSLTTVAAPFEELGSIAVELVNHALAGEPGPIHRTLSAMLVERTSTGFVEPN